MQIDPAIAGLIGVGLGSILGPLGSRWLDAKNAAARRRSISRALAAEITAMLEVSERRDYAGTYTGWLDHWKAGNSDMPRISGLETAAEKGDPVFMANLALLGELPADTVARIVRFYSGAASLRLDLAGISAGNFSRNEAIALVEYDLKYWAEIKALGERLISELTAIK